MVSSVTGHSAGEARFDASGERESPWRRELACEHIKCCSGSCGGPERADRGRLLRFLNRCRTKEPLAARDHAESGTTPSRHGKGGRRARECRGLHLDRC